MTRSFPVSRVRVIKTWHPAHARYYDFLGLALREDVDSVEVAVCGYLDLGKTKTVGVAAVRRTTPWPIPA